MQFVIGLFTFFFGAALGSFIGVIASRYNTGLPFLKGRSICLSCNSKLGANDLVPIFSFLSLGGRCRYCGDSIPKDSFFTEIIMGFLSVFAAYKSAFLIFPFSLANIAQYLLLVLIFSDILLITAYDLKHFIIPDSFLVSLTLLSLVYNLLFIENYSLLLSLAYGIILSIPFLAIFVISRGKWLGFGDVKYIAVIGFLLGLSAGTTAVVIGFWAGAAVSLAALLLGKLKSHVRLPYLGNNLTIKSEIPFGPFLSVGIILTLYFNVNLFQIF